MRMTRPRILLVGGNPPMAEMLADYFHLDDRYEIESVEYGDTALAVLQRGPFDLVLVLSLHVPWTMRPSSYSATWRIDFANAILFLKHLRALHSPPRPSSSQGVCSRRRRKRLWRTGRSPLSPNPSTWPNLTVSCYWLLRAEKAIDAMTRAEHIAVVPFRLAMRKVDGEPTGSG
jgi:CheY-like chemotaxis protein